MNNQQYFTNPIGLAAEGLRALPDSMVSTFLGAFSADMGDSRSRK